MLPFINRNMDEKFAVLHRGANYTGLHGYNTLQQARDDGAVVMAYGYVAISLLRLSRRSRGGISILLFSLKSCAYSPIPSMERYFSHNCRHRAFLNKLINFTGVGLALYCIARLYEYLSNDNIVKRTVRCKYCRRFIHAMVRFTFQKFPSFFH
jgi:large conductance mechanosensitive channel